jgi:hypothetical protein
VKLTEQLLSGEGRAWFDDFSLLTSRFLEDKDIYKFKKKLIYSLRIHLFAKQIIEFGRITDYTAGNNLYRDVCSLCMLFRFFSFSFFFFPFPFFFYCC